MREKYDFLKNTLNGVCGFDVFNSLSLWMLKSHYVSKSDLARALAQERKIKFFSAKRMISREKPGFEKGDIVVNGKKVNEVLLVKTPEKWR